jgi:hypothetical protein
VIADFRGYPLVKTCHPMLFRWRGYWASLSGAMQRPASRAKAPSTAGRPEVEAIGEQLGPLNTAAEKKP